MSNNEVMTWAQAIDVVAPKFNQIAASQNLVTWAEESQFAMQAIQKSEKLAQCSIQSVQNAVINVAAVGLTLNPALGFAYLVPEAEKTKDANGREVWIQSCQLRVSFKGLTKIATDSGSILWARAEIVKEKDKFVYRGACTIPDHDIEDAFGDRGETVGVYCIAKTHQGDFLVDIMGNDEIKKIRAAAKQDHVWKAWPDEMTKKAMLKRASKQWPKTDRDDRLDRAIAVVNEYEGSEELPRQERDITPKQPEASVKQPIEDGRLANVIKKIIGREYTVEALKSRFELTPEQLTKLDTEISQAVMQ